MSIELDREIRTGDTAAETIPLDEQYLILANPYRRLALSIVEGRPTPMSLEELAENVARFDGTASISPDHEEVKILLHHCHLPKLDAHGLVRYDPDERTVTFD